MTVIWQNPGLLPVDAVTTMGVNVKVNSNAIGHFGTGLKIAICSILRMGGTISIWVDGKEWSFYTKKKDVRGKDFEFIMMKGTGLPQQLGMTTELGKNWEPWMVMRELESNCRDEGGSSMPLGNKQFPAPKGMTVVVVTCPEVEAAWHDRHKYFIVGDPVESHNAFDLHKGGGKDFFYRGIKVGEFPKPLPFTVNLKGDYTRRLTEDRTLNSYYAMGDLGAYIPELKRKDVLEALFPDTNRIENPSLIYDIDFDVQYTNPSREFFDRIKYLNKKNITATTQSMFKLCLNHGEMDRHSSMTHYELTDIEKKMLDRAIQYLTDLGYADVTSFRIFKTDLGKEAHGMAIPGEEKIYLAPSAFDMGQKFLCSTLHEEYLHVRYHLEDCSRPMQQHLFDRMATIMENHFYKEPI